MDSPVTFGMTRKEFEQYFQEEYGRSSMDELQGRMVRVDARGTSSHHDDDECVDDTIWLNRAGPKEQILHREEIIEFYVRRRVEPTENELAKVREGLVRCGPECPQRPEKTGSFRWCRRCWGTDYVRDVDDE
jgi:hypothetical protein